MASEDQDQVQLVVGPAKDADDGRLENTTRAVKGYAAGAQATADDAVARANGAQTSADAAQGQADYATQQAAQGINDAATAQATADGKVTSYFQATAPVAEGVGDLWVDTDDGNLLHRWDGTNWVQVRDAGIESAMAAATKAQSTADGKIVSYYQTAAPTGPQKYDTLILKDGPVGYWRLGEASGTVAADSSGNGNDGEYQGTVARVAGALADDTDTAAQFGPLNGADGNRVYRTGGLVTGPGVPWTLEAWVRFPAQADDDDANPILLGEAREDVGNNYITWLYTNNAATVDNLRVLTSDNASVGRQAQVFGTLQRDRWYHIVSVYDGAGWVSGYVDGAFVAKASLPLEAGTWSPMTAGAIGALRRTTWSNGFSGSLDEVAAYDRALTADEIADHNERGRLTPRPPADTPELVYGDLWFDTDDGNKPHHWDGRIEWLPIRDGYIDDAVSTREPTIYRGVSAPPSPAAETLWLDTGVTPHVMKRYNGTTWVNLSPIEAAEIGAAAEWVQTRVASWQAPADQTKIDGGYIVANSVAAEAIAGGTLSNLVTVGNGGLQRIGSTGQGSFVIDGNGIVLYDANMAATVTMSAVDGSAEFTGTIDAKAGNVSGNVVVGGQLKSAAYDPSLGYGWYLDGTGYLNAQSVTLMPGVGLDASLHAEQSPTTAVSGEWWTRLLSAKPDATHPGAEVVLYTTGLGESGMFLDADWVSLGAARNAQLRFGSGEFLRAGAGNSSAYMGLYRAGGSIRTGRIGHYRTDSNDVGVLAEDGGAVVFNGAQVYNATILTNVGEIEGRAKIWQGSNNSGSPSDVSARIVQGPEGYQLMYRQANPSLFLGRTGTAGNQVEFRMYSTATLVGSIYCNSASTSYNTSSDYRLKEDIRPVPSPLDRLMRLKPIRFTWNNGPTAWDSTDGFLAHEVAAIAPYAVTGEKDAVDPETGKPAYQQMDHSKLVPLLTAALQEEVKARQALEARVNDLEARLAALEAAK